MKLCGIAISGGRVYVRVCARACAWENIDVICHEVEPSELIINQSKLSPFLQNVTSRTSTAVATSSPTRNTASSSTPVISTETDMWPSAHCSPSLPTESEPRPVPHSECPLTCAPNVSCVTFSSESCFLLLVSIFSREKQHNWKHVCCYRVTGICINESSPKLSQ